MEATPATTVQTDLFGNPAPSGLPAPLMRHGQTDYVNGHIMQMSDVRLMAETQLNLF